MIKKKNLVQYCTHYFSQVVLIIAPLLTIPYVSRVLGPEQIGRYSYTQSFVTIAILLCTLGIGTYAQREIAAVAESAEKRSGLSYEIIIFRGITVFIGIIVYIVGVLCFARQEHLLLFLLQTIDIVNCLIDIVWLYYGMGLYKPLAWSNMIVKMLYVVSVFSFVNSEADLWIYVLCHSVTNVLGNVFLCFFAKKNFVWTECKKLSINQHIIPVIVLLIPQIATQIYTVLDKCMLGWLNSDMNQSGYYEQSTKIVHTILMLITSFGVIMLSDNMKKSNDNKDIKIRTGESLEFIMLLAIPVAIGCIAIADEATYVLLGQGFEPAILIVRVLSLNVMVIAVSNVVGVQYLLVLRRQKEYVLSVVCGAVTNVCLNFFLIRYLQAFGAAVASVFAEIMVMAIQIFLLRKELKIKKEIKRNILKCFVGAVAMFGIVRRIADAGWSIPFGLFVQVLCGIICYIAILLCLKEKYSSYMLDTIRKYVKRK